MSEQPITPDVSRARIVRTKILRILHALRQGDPSMAEPVEDLIESVMAAGGPLGYAEAEVREAIQWVLDVGMAEADQRRIRLTVDGADFVLARCPWARVDKFTGGARPG